MRAAAATIGGRGGLDGLLLNAGIVHPPKDRETTADGHEVVFATNVLGHFALAGALLTTLAAASGRMVWLGSMSTSLWPYDPVDPQLVEDYSGWRAYVQSKVAHRGARLRGRPAPARRRRAGRQRRRAPRATRRAAARRDRRRERADAGSRGSPTTCRPRSRSPRSAARGRSCARSSTPTSRAAQFSGPRLRGRAVSRTGAGRRRSRATRRSPNGCGGVCEDATGVRWPFAASGSARRSDGSAVLGAEPDRPARGGRAARRRSPPIAQGRGIRHRHRRRRPRRRRASTARSSSGSRSLTRSTRPVWPGAASASSTKGSRWTLPRGIRNRIAVRIEARAAQALVDALEEPVAQRVLEHLGLVVHFVPARSRTRAPARSRSGDAGG